MIGVDEVGRGCIAGPMLVVAARSSSSDYPIGLKDSKQLTRLKRNQIYAEIVKAYEFGQGWVSPSEIDNLGLTNAIRLATGRALSQLKAESTEEIIIDGSMNYIPAQFIRSRALVKADSLIPIVSVASVFAKVERDAYMKKIAKANPEYSFDEHVGYGTTKHLLAIKKYGPIRSVHRFSFAPIRKTIVV